MVLWSHQTTITGQNKAEHNSEEFKLESNDESLNSIGRLFHQKNKQKNLTPINLVFFFLSM